MTGESRKCACGRTYTLPLPYDAANPEIRDLCPGLGGVPPCVPAISTPAPEPDEKCEVCGNPLEYHNNAYRWCKNMHSFRYFQTPHTSPPAPAEIVPAGCSKFSFAECVQCDKQFSLIEHDAGIRIEAAKAAREQVLDKIMWYMANHGVEKRPEGYYVVSGTFSLGGFIKHIESLRAQQEPQQ